jgi:adenosylcobinamide kinase / adenosylcobinamide-phosphate guanylyltransferase
MLTGSIIKKNSPTGGIVFITGGARSGKSRYAQQMALTLSANPIYVATAKNWGGDFSERINRHQKDRGKEWINIEIEKYVSKASLANRVCVIDCVTLWLTNFFYEHLSDIDKSLVDFKKEIDALENMSGTFIIVSNEIGMGVHAETAVGRQFTDLQGWANQYVATKAKQVILMVSGIPITIKNSMDA